MFYAKISDVSAVAYDSPELYNQAIHAGAAPLTEDEYVALSRSSSFSPILLAESAKNQLGVVTGPSGQFMRAVAAGISPNDSRLAPWQTYVQALRAIANVTDTTSTTLPTPPAYIQGT